MKIFEYGKENNEVIILLHGGGMSWWNYKDEAELLKDKFHVVIPILDGHSDSDRDFTSIEDNAEEIIEYIDNNFNGSVFMIGGLSLGGQILVEILSQRTDICRYAVVESALVIPMPEINKLLEPSINMSYGLINKNWFSKLQFKSLKIRSDLYDYYYTDTCKISKENMIAFLKANQDYKLKESIQNSKASVKIFVGGKEQKSMRKSSEMINKAIKNSTLQILDGYYHGDLSVNHPDQYVDIIRNLPY